MKTLAVIEAEGFRSSVTQFENGRVEFIGDADIDADGANGQNGLKPAYTVRDDGSEFLANGGMGIRNGRVVGVTDWYRDIVILDGNDQPKVFDKGIIASKTAYRTPGFSPNDPRGYIDSEGVPYVVVSPLIRQRARGIVLGCRAVVTHTISGKVVECVVGDIGPRNKVGELSIQAARMLGLPSSPRTGGEDRPRLKYELFPGVRVTLASTTFHLLRMGV